MQIVEVKDRKTEKAFLCLPEKVYANDPYWIPHLEKDVKAVFDPQINPQFLAGKVIRWILLNNKGSVVGRVAAFVNENLAHTYNQPTGGMGFFECINNKQAAFALFDQCKSWLEAQGMQAMDGPVNFGEKERFWGLFTDGYGQHPPYLMNYHPPYYKELFEAYGFKNYYNQVVFQIHSNTVLPPIIERKFQRLTETQGYHFEHLKISQLDKYAEDFMYVYNDAWGKVHKNFRPMTKQQALQTFYGMKSVVVEELIIFGYHHGKPMAFLICLPELNQLFRYVNGKLNLIGKLKFLYHKWRGKCTHIYGLVFGIHPDYQNRGIESALIMSMKHAAARNSYYKKMIITWIGDFNPKMIRIVEHIGAERAFSLTTYRKLFRDELPFERHPQL